MKKQKRKKIIAILFCLILILQLLSFYSNVKANTYIQTVKTGIENFPQDYKEKLEILHEMYPNWKFTAYYTGITWDEFIQAETSVHLRNTVIKTSDSLWKDSCEKIASGYSCASKPIIQYYADPRNFINEAGIFQFLEMTYNEEIQTEESVKNIIKNSFMDKEISIPIKIGEEEKDTMMHYSQIIMQAAKESKMSPYSIAIKIIQEVGRKGSSSVTGHYVSANGTVYDGYYNFFNYGAYDTGDAIANGLEYAKNNGWVNPYIAIIEGSKLMANSYTNAGQNTAYFYKWDVVGKQTSELFWHQYMTNIQDPASQAKSLYNTYVSNELLSANLSFVIPVFEDMPNAINLPTTIDTTLESSYYLTGSDVRLRSEPSTSSSILATLDRDVVVTLLNWNAGTANGYEWAKIRLVNGIEGYIAKNYIKPCNKVEEKDINIDNEQNKSDENTTDNNNQQNIKDDENPQIDNNKQEENTNLEKNNSENTNQNENNNSQPNIENSTNQEIKSNNEKIVKVDGDFLIVSPNTKNKEIIETLNIKEYKLIDSSEQEIDINIDSKIGNKLKIEEKEYQIITFGDVNGDGGVNSLDALKILKYDVGSVELKGEFLKISDVNKSGTVDTLDALKILKYDVNLAEITL